MFDSRGRLNFILSLVAVLTCVISTPAAAYLGPGAGLSAIGSLLALVLAVVVAIFGFLWYPVKRLMKKRRSNDRRGEEQDQKD